VVTPAPVGLVSDAPACRAAGGFHRPAGPRLGSHARPGHLRSMLARIADSDLPVGGTRSRSTNGISFRSSSSMVQLKRHVGLVLALAALFSCQNEYKTERAPAGSDREVHAPEATRLAVNATEEPQVRTDSAEAARQLAEQRGVSARFREASQQTADGERVRVFVPEPAPSVDVLVGSQCGAHDARGAVLSCAGSYCLKASDGANGRCVAAPTAPTAE
jgi:hypothetical protein